MRPVGHILLLGMLTAFGAAADAGVTPALPALPPHPRLLLDARGVAQLEHRIAEPAWSTPWAVFRRKFDQTIDEPVELPPRGGNWWHWYVCPKHGAALKQGRKIGPWQWEHICPVDGHVFRGDPTQPARDYDGCVLAGVHDAYARAIRDAGLLYAVTGEERYLRRGREILLAYAERYRTYPLHTIQGIAAIGGGRIGSQTLDESTWLIPVAQGADLLWPALTESERQTLATALFLPAVRGVILPHKLGVHNIQCWMNAAMGLTGFLVDDPALIRTAIDDPKTGYRTQMAKGVLSDGVWREGAWGYHFYTLSAVLPLAEAARNCGIDLYGEPLRQMLDAPLALAMPNLKLPAFNDSHEGGISANLYELGYARYHDPAFLRVLAGRPRANDFALWYGAEALPPATEAPLEVSRNDAAGGYAILRHGDGASAAWLCVKYGPHGGGHGHPDKLTFVLYASGQTVCPDAGTRSYGSPLHADWDKTTLAHNTLVVDLTNQAPTCGRSLAFGATNGVDYAMTEAGPIYRGLRFVRTALLVHTNAVVFVDQIQADEPHVLDVVCHGVGAWQPLPASSPFALPDAPGYRHLAEATTRSGGDGAVLTIAGARTPRLSVVLAAGAPTEIVTASGIGRDTSDRVPVVLFRRRAASATYAWGIALGGSRLKIDLQGDPVPPIARVRVETDAGLWQVDVDGAKGAVAVSCRRPGNPSP